MIKINNLVCGYNKKPILCADKIQLSSNTITSIVGINGCGKSTLLKTACGVINHISGDILINDKSIFTLTLNERAKLISYFPQTRSIGAITSKALVMHGRFPHLGYPRRYSKADYEICKNAMQATDTFSLANKKVSELSGGEKQRVFLAMTLTQDTPIIFFDEPTTYLDIANQLEMSELIKNLRDIGKTIVLVIHDLELALSISDNIIVVNNNKTEMFNEPLKAISSIEKAFSIKTTQVFVKNRIHYIFEKTN